MVLRLRHSGTGLLGAKAPGRTEGSRLRLEDLEERLLLTIDSGVYPDYITGAAPATTPLEQAQAAALRDTQGPTLIGGDGPLAKIGLDLAEVYEEHQLFDAGADGTSSSFVPSNPEIQVNGADVALNASASGNAQTLATALTGLGMSVTATADQIVSGWFPIDKLTSLATASGLQFARAAYKPMTEAGLYDSQGDKSLHADTARTQFGFDGTGITVGVISDSFNTSGDGSAAADVASGDLPAAGVNVLADTPDGTDEGRAMTQIVHDVAPGAAIAFQTSGASDANMAQAINALHDTAGAEVIADDVRFFDEPIFQDGVIAQAVDKVQGEGVAYFSAAGNSGAKSYQAPFSASTTAGPAGGMLQNFGTSSNVATKQQVTIPSGDQVTFDLQWTQAFQSLGGSGAASQINMYLLDSTGTIVAKANDVTVGGDALQLLQYANTGSNSTFNVEIELVSGPAPSLIKYLAMDESNSVTIDTFNTNSSTDIGHSNAAGAIGVAAVPYYDTPAFGQTPPLLENFSSEGGTPIYFDDSGNLLPQPVTPQSPAVAGPDGVNTTFFAPTTPGITYPSNPAPFNFFGTSAATPHVAAVAALMLQAAGGPGSLTPDTIRTILEQSSTAISGSTQGFVPGSAITPIPGPVGVNYYAGFGLVDADKAVDAARLKPPTAVDDTVVTNENVPVAINVLANDITNTNPIDPTSVAIGQAPAHGTVQIDPSTGIVTYVPNKNYFGPDSFTYTVSDVKGNVSNAANVAITVNFVDQPPTAVNDLAVTDPAKPVTINVLANDFTFSSQTTLAPASLKIVQQPANGTAQIVNNEIVYTPAAGFIGGDSLKYTVNDSLGLTSNVAVAAIRVGDPVSLSGIAYVDANGDGIEDDGEVGIPNVTIELSKTNGSYTFTTFALTGANGAYQFAEGTNYIMPAGVYNVKEINPGFFVPGISTMGTPAATGPNGNGEFDGITLAPDQQATGYDFGSKGLSAQFAAAYFNRRAFLASTGPDFTGLNLTSGPNWISFDTGVNGTLTALAQFNPALGSVSMALVNSNMQTVATAAVVGGQAELTFSGNSSSPYFLEVTGTNPNVKVNSYATGAPQIAPPPTPPTPPAPTPPATQFHNTVLPADVNGDGLVTALDALTIINDLDSGKVGALSSLSGMGSSMVDVNGDGQITALDALMIINELNTAAATVTSSVATAQVAATLPTTITPTDFVAAPAALPAADAQTDTSSVAFALAVAQSAGQLPAASPAVTSATNTSTAGGSPASAAANSSAAGSTAAAGSSSGGTTRSAVRPGSSSSQLADLIWTDEEAW